jgi:hypothetical protein
MEQRFNDFQNHKIDLRALHVMVYDTNNVALALRQLSQSGGKMAKGPDEPILKPLSLTPLTSLRKL